MVKVKTKKNKAIYYFVVAALLLAISIVIYFRYIHNASENPTEPTTVTDNTTKTTSTSPSAQENYDDAEGEKEPGNSLSENRGSGTIVDSENVATNENPISSEDGNTQLYTPAQNDILTSGSVLSGQTKNDNVHFRLIDNKAGVIGTGQLKLNDQRQFSGSFEINNHGTMGRLDIFSIDEQGLEVSLIELSVRFEQ